MEQIAPLGGVYQAGTLSGNPLAMAAGNAMLSKIEQNHAIYQQLEERTANLLQAIKEHAEEHGIPLQGRAVASMLWIAFQQEDPTTPQDVTREATQTYAEFHYQALKEGLYLPPSAYEVWFLSTAHTQNIIDKTAEKIDSVFSKMKRKRE